jgi:hypothetical protein
MREKTSLIICLLSSGIAALILLGARSEPQIAPFFLIFFIISVFACSKSEHPGYCLGIIAATTTLTLSFRFPYLTWGDPWQDYEGILEVLVQGSTATAGYRLQQPTLAVLVASLSGFTGISPMGIQKIAIPLIGSLSVPALYSIGRYYTDRKTALTASIIFLTGIPYLHWASQGVRETLGIPFFLISIWFSLRAVKTRKTSDIILSLLIITGLILTHHQSAFLFCVVFSTMAMVEIYLFTTPDRTLRETCIIGLIAGITLIATLLWWQKRIPFIYTSFLDAVNQLLFRDNEIRIVPVVFAFLLFVLFLSLPSLFPGLIRKFRFVVQRMYVKRVFFLYGIYIMTLFGGIILFGLLSGHSFLTIQYPPQMILIGILSLLLILAGLPEFIITRRFQVLIFAAVPAVMLFLGVTRIIPGMDILWTKQIDPLRFLGYLWPPLALMAGAGMVRIFPEKRWWLIGIITVGTLSLLAVFPSIVFLGETFEQNSPFYDNRSLVISHPSSEIQAIHWYGIQQGTSGSLTSDRYAFSAARWLNTQGKQVTGPMNRPSERRESGYWLLTSRMDTYANFVEWVTGKPQPVSPEERGELDRNTVRIYDNGDAVIYRV